MLRTIPNVDNSTSLATTICSNSAYKSVYAAVADARKVPGQAHRWLKFPISLRYRRVSGTTSAGVSLFSALPEELIIHILLFLPPTDIASIQAVSRTLRDTVKESAALQWVIEAFLAGVVAGPAVKSLSTSRARLDRLAKWKHARRGRHWENVWEYPANQDLPNWKRIHGQTFSAVNSASTALQLTTIPSRLAGTSLKTRYMTFPTPILDHWFDSSQEVVVVRTHNPQGESILAFLHETTGDSFPEIKTPEVPLCANLLEEEAISRSKVDVQILGNLNLIHRKIKSLRKDITIRDWRSDTTFVTISSDSGKYQLPQKIAFLDEDHLVGIMFASHSVLASVVVIPWRKLPGGDISITDAIGHSTMFQLPEPSSGNIYAHVHIDSKTRLFCERNTTWYDDAPKDAPFFDSGRQPPLIMLDIMVAPDREVDFAVALNDPDEWKRICADRAALRFVIPGCALLSRVAALDATVIEGVRTIPWSGWGEDTRVWPQTEPGRREVQVYGSRLFCIEKAKPYTKTAVIYDFDSAESMVRDIRSSDKTHLDEIVIEPSHLTEFHAGYLQEPVVTRAPYRRLKSNIETYGIEQSIFGQDCFLLCIPASGRVMCYSIYDN